MSLASIKITGARQHNLKNINVEIPRDKLTVVTGLSGSGKSSLVFDTIYAEGQRRYIESLSTYARQFLELMEKPDVDSIEGLSPAIAIDQKSASRNPRSTVGTVTEIYDYLRLLYAKIGMPHCPSCGKPVEKQSVEEIANQLSKWPEGSRLHLLAPIVVDRKGEHKSAWDAAKKDGFVRLRVDGAIVSVAEDVQLDPKKKHSIEIVIDRILWPKAPSKEDSSRLVDSIELALKVGNGVMIVLDPDSGKEDLFSEFFACSKCGINLPEISPRSFSFNSPHGACLECHGLGKKHEVDRSLVIPNKRLTVAEGAIMPWARTSSSLSWYNHLLREVCKKYNFSIDVPVKEMSKEALDIVFNGTGNEAYKISIGADREYNTTYEGVIPNLERRYQDVDSDYVRREIEKYMRETICPKCNGKRLKPEILAVKVAEKSIIDITELSIAKSKEFFSSLKLSEYQYNIARLILKEITARLQFLINVGLEYLTLDRAASTLAGGEAQRIRLATQIGSSLLGVLYVLDEPSIGLHQRDNDRLIKTLERLRDLGNTVVVVEHDASTILSADYLLDMGPGAGEDGGNITACGTPKEVMKNSNSLTAQYLSGKKEIAIPKKRRRGNGKYLEIINAHEHNLQNINAKFPLGCLVGVTGVSGSGKSTLIDEILAKALSVKYHRARHVPGAHEEIRGIEHMDKIININQKPIGRTPRSNPATYTGVFNPIRELFAAVPEARMRGYKSGRFSFNVKGGRCEACRGDGIVKIEMHFLPDIYVTCETCKGRRYNKQALEIVYKGKTIADVLEMSVSLARKFFSAVPKIEQKLAILEEVGLGYIKLGQSATTLSGGEAQRIKLATELARKSTGRTLYILDEPTTGLHFEDIKCLLGVLYKLVDSGNTVLVIEHNLDVIKCCDWIMDLGPEGGDNGGKIVGEGSPENISKIRKSYTGQYLKLVLNKSRVKAI